MKPILLHIVLCAAMILCIGNAALGQATATVTKAVEGLNIISAELGDRLSVRLTVANPYDAPVLVVDNLGSTCKYIAGTCLFDGVSLTPALSDNMISLPVGRGYHEITYQFQVTQVEAYNTFVSNVARVHGLDSTVDDEDSLQITLSAYDGFFKWVSCEDHDLKKPLPLGEDIKFTMLINVRNYFGFTMEDLEVSDDLPAEFEADAYWPEEDVEETISKGKAKKVRWTWTIGDLACGDAERLVGVSLKISVSTALNPAGKQHFVSPGRYDVAKQIVVKFRDPSTGNELRACTGSFSVYAGP